MFFCPDCHVSNRSDAKFCRKCGKSRFDLERDGVVVSAVQTSNGEVVSEDVQVDYRELQANVEEVGDRVELDVVDSAPQLSDNIEQGQSLTAPPDLTTPECPSCWKALRATDKFCCWCGEAQPNRVLPFLKLCLECNTFLPEKANFCYSCGTDVGYSSRRKVRVPHELFKDEESEFFPRFDA
jgi:RNA polymerase subunit RPABC4/transcription elongation factor Spt4